MKPIHALLISCLLCAAGPDAGAVDGIAARHPQLKAIDKLSETAPLAALAQLEALKASFTRDTPYELRRDLLRVEVWLREDAGQLEQSYAADREALALATANNDQETILLSSLASVRQLLDQNQVVKAKAALEAILARAPKVAPPMLATGLDMVRGDVHNAEGKYDKALAFFLSAMRREEARPDSEESQANLAIRVAQIHINSDHPAKALQTVDAALALGQLPVRTTARLESTRGITLVQLGRNKDAYAAFLRALDAARTGSMIGLEAQTRGNIADYFLRQHDYVRAAEEARLALIASEKVNNENLIVMAKANLGFALMGQGRFAEGIPWIDGVAAELEKAGASADLDGLLDEKGRMQERAGLFKDALATVRAQQAVQKADARAARDKAIAALQEEYDASTRTRQIEQLRRENRLQDADLKNRRLVQLLTTFAAVLTVLAGAIVLVLYRRAARSNAQLHQLNTQLEFHSMRDALTGLHNRRSFGEKMKARALRSDSERRHDAADGVDCLALMDIDHFKHINDRWGHGVGDAVLVEVARRLTAAVRDSDMVLRWGGEEFLIFAPGADPDHIADLMARVLEGIGSTPVDAGSCMVPVTLTAGVVTLPLPGMSASGQDWERGIRLADWALYRGKAEGRNQARIVTRLAGPVDEVLATLDQGADGSALVQMQCVRGPLQSPAAAA